MVVALIDRAGRMEWAEYAAPGIAQARFSVTLVYERPAGEVEVALREFLAVDPDPVSRARSAGAAYATHAVLRPYFEVTVANLEAAVPRTPVIQRALQSAARVREVAAEQHGGGETATPDANAAPDAPAAP